MSGIVGGFYFDRSKRIDPETIDAVRVASQPWGAKSGVVSVPGCFLAQAKTDEPTLIEEPVWDSERRLVAVFDGSLRNQSALKEQLSKLGHRFRRQAAVDLVLAAYRAWGVDCAEHLDGIFAFAVFDRRAHTLFLARDRLGGRPLFVYEGRRRLCFASGTRPLLAQNIPRVLDPEAADDFLTFGFVAGSRSLLRHVKPVVAGGAVYSVRHRVRRWSYWSLKFDTISDLGLNEHARAVVDATRSGVADAGEGAVVALSGGLGAAIVAAAASERWPSPVRALTVRWQGADEAQAAADTAHALKAVHAVLPSGPRVSMVPDDGELPVDAFALVWRSLAEAMKPHGTTVWTGLGTDFIFAGRSSYGRILKRCGGGWLRSPSLWRGTRPSAAELRTALIRDMGRSEHRAWYAQDFLRGLRGYNGVQGCLSQVEAFDGEPLSALQHFDLTVTVPCGLMPMLEQVERVTGLRWRHPFFDTDTVSLMAAMPAHHRFDAGRRVILDRAAGLILPPNLIERPSRGLSPPVNHWLAHDLQAVVQTRLFGSRGSGLFDAKALRRAWYGLMLGRSQWAPSLIRVAALEGWAQRVLS